MANALTSPGTISAHLVLNRCIFWIIRYLGIIVTWGGTIMVASIRRNRDLLNLNSYFANTYPINVLVRITAKVITAVITMLLTSHSPIGAFSKALR